MVSRHGRTSGHQNGMKLPEGITSSRPTTLWKIIKVLKDDGPANWEVISVRLKKRWKNFPTPSSLYTTLARRTDVFVLIDEKGKIYDLKGEIRDAMD